MLSCGLMLHFRYVQRNPILIFYLFTIKRDYLDDEIY